MSSLLVEPALPSTAQVFQASLLAGANPLQVAATWLGIELAGGNADGALQAVESCRTALGLKAPGERWGWPQALQDSGVLCGLLHITQFYQLEDMWRASGDHDGADSILQSACKTFPAASGPVLRFSAALEARGDTMAAARTLGGFLKREPGDLYAAVNYARLATATGKLREVNRILEAAVRNNAPPASLIGIWLDYCFRWNDASGARRAVAACAPYFGLEDLGRSWTWPEALAKSGPLRRALHITHFHALEQGFLESGDTEAADVVMEQASIAYPQFSGPVLKLAERRVAAGDLGGADALLASCLRRLPGDIHAALRYARLPLQSGSESERARVLGKSLKAGVPVDALIAPWLSVCFDAKDIESARRAVEICAEELGIPDIEAGWTWDGVLAASQTLRRALHLGNYYFIDSLLAGQSNITGAIAVMRQAMEVFPDYSGPVLRLCERLELTGNRSAAESCIADFLRRHPGDLHAEAYAVRVSRRTSVRKPNLKDIDGARQADFDRRFAFCRRLIAGGRHSGRAVAVMAGILGRHSLEFSGDHVAALPALFEAAAFNLYAIRELLGQLKTSAGKLRCELPSSPAYSFVRGATAFDAQEFSEARIEFSAYAAAFPASRGALAARHLLQYLESAPIEDKDYVSALRRPNLWPDAGGYANQRLLVYSDVEPVDAEPFLATLPANSFATVCFSHARDHSRKSSDPERLHYVIPGLYVWFSDQGRVAHRHLERITTRAAAQIGEQLPRFAEIPWALAAFFTDNALYDFAALKTVERELASGVYDRVIAVTRRYTSFLTLRSMSDRALGQGKADVAWISRPTLLPPPAIAYWPGASDLRAQFLHKRTRHQYDRRFGRPLAPLLPTPDAVARINAEPPALIVWSIGEPNYNIAILQLVETVLTRRPAILLIYGDTDQRIARLADALLPLAKRSGRSVQIMRYETLLRLGTAMAPDLQPPMRRALTAGDDSPGAGENSGVIDSAFARYELAMTVASSANIGAMAAGLDWLDTLFTACKPAYVVTAPGRSPFPAMVAEYAQKHGIEAIDTHMYFLADSARQLRPPHRFHATIDTLLQDFLQDHWKIERERLLLVGYLWQRPKREMTNADLPPEAAALLSHRKIVLLATQPAPMQLTEEFMHAFLGVMIAVPDCALWLKPHPKEVQAAVALYAGLLQKFGMTDRAVIIGIHTDIAPLIARADLVVTRTSNVGLEAAQSFKPVVRGVFLDKFLPPAWLNTRYAFNSKTPEEMKSHIISLLHDEGARALLRQQQIDYFAENPSLVDGKGTGRLVDFMEARLAAARSPGS